MTPRPEDIYRARTVYLRAREIWFAPNELDAYERLSLVTVAAKYRPFAFLTQLSREAKKSAASLLGEMGFRTQAFSVRFDLNFRTPGLTAEAAEAYALFNAAKSRFLGLGIWLQGANSPKSNRITTTTLGTALEYPECCVRMDLETKLRDHQLALKGVIAEVGASPDEIRHALLRKVRIVKASDKHLRRWRRRHQLTRSRFPFVLHAACDECLNSRSSATAKLNRSFEELTQEVSGELHFLIRWSARILTGGMVP